MLLTQMANRLATSGTPMVDSNQDVISVGIYILGDQLDPEYISEKLNAEPSRREKNGESKISKGKNITIKKGLWAKEVILKGRNVEKHLEQLLFFFQTVSAIDVLSLDNVSDAHMDIYVGTSVMNKTAQASFLISGKFISELGKLKIPLMITFSADEGT